MKRIIHHTVIPSYFDADGKEPATIVALTEDGKLYRRRLFFSEYEPDTWEEVPPIMDEFEGPRQQEDTTAAGNIATRF